MLFRCFFIKLYNEAFKETATQIQVQVFCYIFSNTQNGVVICMEILEPNFRLSLGDCIHGTPISVQGYASEVEGCS